MSKLHSSGVYQIRNINTGKRYIGSAARTFRERWKAHRCDLRHKKHHSKYLQRAWNKYGEAAFAFEILLICKPEHCVLYEQICIDAFRAADSKYGYNTVPIAGSSLGFRHSEEKKAYWSRIRKGRVNSPEARAKMSAARKGMVKSPEHIAKVAAFHRGRKRSAETRAKISIAMTGKKRSAEAVAAMRNRPCSAETRAKISAIVRGRKVSSITLARMSAAALARRKKPAKNQKVLF